MHKRKCKSVNIDLSVLGTGCWTFGGGEYWGNQNQKDVTDVVHASVDLGINYFDTAEAYNEGRSESSLGEAIKGISRNKVVIGSKVSPSNCYKDTLIKHCEASLKRLQTDYIDLYMIHWPIHAHSLRHFTNDIDIIENPPTIHETIDDLRILKQQGKIKEYGVSNFSKGRLEALPAGEVAVNQIAFNILSRAAEFDALPYCEENGIGVIGYMALMQGILTGKFNSIADIPILRKRTRHFNSKGNNECRHGESGAETETNDAIEGICKLCKKTGLSMTEIAMQWILANPAITCTLVGSRNIQQLEANIKAIEKPLDFGIKMELDRYTFRLKEKLGNHLDYFESVENDRTL